jgi:hypothetical protein
VGVSSYFGPFCSFRWFCEVLLAPLVRRNLVDDSAATATANVTQKQTISEEENLILNQ